MKIVFELKCNDKKELDLRESFCEFMVNSIKSELTSTVNLQKIDEISKKILSLKWISWSRKPVHINPYQLMSFIANNVEYRNIKNSLYIIRINPIARYPGSKTRLIEFVKFLDKGNMNIKGSHVIGSIFNKHAGLLNKLWEMFKSHKLKRYAIENSFVIK